MSDDHSDGEGSGGHKADLVDTTEDMEIELHLPREVAEAQARHREDIQKPLGTSPWVRLLSARRSDIDSSPQTGPDLNGPTRPAPPEYFGTS